VLNLLLNILRKRIDNVVIVSGPYNFLVLLNSNIDIDLERTLFLTEQNFPSYLSDKFIFHKKFNTLPKKQVEKLFFYLIYKLSVIPLKILLKLNQNMKYIGCDHFFFSDLFLDKYTLVEDGLANYNLENKRKSFFLGETFGKKDQCKKIILTGIEQIPKVIEDKVEIIKLIYIKKYEIFFPRNKINFNSDLKRKNLILITQPLSEDGYCDEMKKLEIYSFLLKEYIEKKFFNIIIKTHPREITDYNKVFPDTFLLNNEYPLEIYNLYGYRFDFAITLFSSALYNINANNKIFVGTEKYDFLIKQFGVYKFRKETIND